MTMPTTPGTITVGSGGSNLPDGLYTVALTKIEQRPITPRSGPNAGIEQDGYDWTFVVMQGEYEDEEIRGRTSLASGPKSKLYAWLTALFNGQAPAAGTILELGQLTGRMALATIQRNTDGWPRIVSLSPIPPHMLQQQFGQATGAPVQAQQPIQQPQQPPVPVQAPQAGQQPVYQPAGPSVVPQQPVPPAPVAQQPAAPVAQQPNGGFTMPAGQPLREQVAGPGGKMPF